MSECFFIQTFMYRFVSSHIGRLQCITMYTHIHFIHFILDKYKHYHITLDKHAHVQTSNIFSLGEGDKRGYRVKRREH